MRNKIFCCEQLYSFLFTTRSFNCNPFKHCSSHLFAESCRAIAPDNNGQLPPSCAMHANENASFADKAHKYSLMSLFDRTFLSLSFDCFILLCMCCCCCPIILYFDEIMINENSVVMSTFKPYSPVAQLKEDRFDARCERVPLQKQKYL